jgi:hypothetical protein
VHSGAGHRAKDAEGPSDVVVEIGAWVGDGILDGFEGREMNDRIDPMTVDRGRQEVGVAHVADDERQRLDRRLMSAPQVIDHDDAVPRIGEVARCQRTDVPSATCDQDVHRAVRRSPVRRSGWGFSAAGSCGGSGA